MLEYTAAQKQEIEKNIKQMASEDPAVAFSAQRQFAMAAEVPIRETLLSGDILGGIYTPDNSYQDKTHIMYMLDLLSPNQERDFYAYVLPNHGTLPERRVEADYLMIPTYRIGNAIDAEITFIEDANWNVIGRMMQILEAGFVKKINDDGWQTILAAAVDRNIIVYDQNASQGQFTPTLVTLMKTFMRRNGGGNSATMNRSKLTDLYVSPEAMDDIRSWNLELVADNVRSNIYYSADDGTELVRILGVNIHDLDELGESQEYQNYFTNNLSGSMNGNDVEIVVGLDLSKKENVFVNPVKKALRLFEDNTKHREGMFGIYGYQTHGFGCLDNRAVLLGSI